MRVSELLRNHHRNRSLVLLFVIVLALGLLGRAGAQGVPPGPTGVYLTEPLNGEAAIAALGARLPEVAALNGRGTAELTSLLRRDVTLWVSPSGLLFFRDPPLPQAVEPPAHAPFPYAVTFQLHSRSGSSRVIFLDFDGFTMRGSTKWANMGGTQVGGYSTEGDASFSAAEQDVIQAVWQRIAEDYAPFDVDVTTEDPGNAAIDRSGPADTVFGTRLVFSSDATAWLRACDSDCGGVAFVSTFAHTSEHSNYQPAFVFSNGAPGVKNLAEAGSHEAGHNLGLLHDGLAAVPGRNAVGYYTGCIPPATACPGAWAPIMGVGYFKPVTQWSKGEYQDADNPQDDLAVIQANGLSLRADDHGDSAGTATALGSAGTFSSSGVITTAADTDYFAFTAGAGTITATVSPAPNGPNLDISLQLRNSAGAVLTTVDPTVAMSNADVATGMDATLAFVLPAGGTYYLAVSGVGSGSASSGGYSDYASLGQYSISGTFPRPNTCSETNATFVTKSPSPTIQPGSSASIFMTVRNAGGCEWTAAAGYGWRGTDGLAGEKGSLWQPVPAGGNLTFEREVIPPSTPGTYRYGVQLTRNGTDFGPSMFVDVIVVAWPTSCPTGQYLAEWYPNRTLSGLPVQVRCENAPLNYDWLDTPPAGANVSQMNYSVRWQGTFSFATTGTYRFIVSNDDGMKIWIDGTQVYSSWTDPQVVTGFLFDRSIAAGSHVVRIEYYEADGWAKAAVAWSLYSQAPAAPGGLTATATSSTSVRVAWTDTSVNEQAFAIYRMPAVGGTPAVVGTVGAGVTSFVNTGLTSGGQYRYWVAAGNGYGWTGAPAWVSVTLPSGSAPAAPSGLTATSLGADSIRVAWVDNSTNEQVFAVYRSLNGVASLVTTVPAGTTSLTVTGLLPGTPYGFWVAAGNSFGWAGAPGWVAAMTTMSSPPAAPTNVTTEALSAHSILIQWADASSDEQSFAIYRAPVGGAATLLGTVPANSVSFTDVRLTAGTTYQYWIAAGNSAGWRGAASWVPGRTMGPFVAGITAPTANPPAGVAYTVVATSNVDLYPTPYFLYVYNVATGEVIGWCGGTDRCSTEAPALAPGESATYRARIATLNSVDVEAISPPLTFTAPAVGNIHTNPPLTGARPNATGDLTIHQGESSQFTVSAARTAGDISLVERVELTVGFGPGERSLADGRYTVSEPESKFHGLPSLPEPREEWIPLNTGFKSSFNVWDAAGRKKRVPGVVLTARSVP